MIENSIRKRRLGLSSRFRINFDQIRLESAFKLSDFEDESPASQRCGPMASARINNQVIAVGSEQGLIYLVNINDFSKIVKDWIAHVNTISDMKTQPNAERVLTASGDLSLKLWDIESEKWIKSFGPHKCSTKSISFYDTNILCTGSRDGTIKVHDLRKDQPTVLSIPDAHRNLTFSRRRPSKLIFKSDPTNCVTSTVFDPYIPRIYSAGANDATIKIWDLRKLQKLKRNHRCDETFIEPAHKIHHPKTGSNCGYSQLLFSNCQLFAGCSDHKIYRYDNLMSEDSPTIFTGFHYEPYFKIATLEDRLLVSGSKIGAIVWNLEHTKSSIYPETRLPLGHLEMSNNMSSETIVIETDWEALSIFTFRDDFQACKWAIN